MIDAASGYQGGARDKAEIQAGPLWYTERAETVRVIFDPVQVGYGRLLEWFFTFCDPRHKSRQNPNIGTPYRLAIFATG